VELTCEYLRDAGIGTAVALRVATSNIASVRVAERGGFALVREFTSQTDVDAEGRPLELRLYRRTL
jgi:RimJ/RimL family protein N-acetyltransferase